jgi:enolase-phosphatase E1
MVKYILTDIEGTTTPITFVHDVLFPYSYQHLPAFVRRHEHDPIVASCLRDTLATAKDEGKGYATHDEAVVQLLTWIKEDRKHPALKTLQGLIWRSGYDSGAFQAQVYPDVKPNLASWRAKGLKLGVYSSGSVEAQKLLFGHTPEGDLTSFFSHYFDTAIGGKRERDSYVRILKALNEVGSDVLFLSDIPQELVAAREAGLATVQLIRPGTPPADGERHAKDFYEVASIIGR